MFNRAQWNAAATFQAANEEAAASCAL